jgi:hypothetical protein
MARFKTAALAAAIAASALSAGTAQAAYSRVSCDIEVHNSRDGSGSIVATASGSAAASYELVAAQIIPGGSIDLSQSGPVNSRGHGRTVLGRAYLSTLYDGPPAAGPEGPRGVRPAQFGVVDGRYGVDASVAAILRVYDRNGRQVCYDQFTNLAFGGNRFGR